MHVFMNFPLWAALIAIVFSQVIKIPINLIVTKTFKPGLAFSNGGMPSSHSAAVAALTTSIGIVEGISSTMFAVSCVFSIIVMFDASGVRKQAGEQAILLNQLRKDLLYLIEGAKDWGKKAEYEKRQELKELLGHEPIEVFFGGLTGICLALLLYMLY
ncbi:divergent PAP2 family protein [Virgibacillus dakarensis]|uniref:Membrane protein n=1 Tax=Lentibacillus populi TaxID=1827502 RepID=A0A9W5TW51_9BACI|nr:MULTISPECIES: divergent PAP2 family protein [Bacillaceae]MBT2217076.1 divergent PAP2 family protein [Virgibacillus dakarensis]MTW84672.1 divergent PAP2 family protein [Virgibacillus dakarensis]GGB36715.1 membrane protein [Lentibacillus populi]